MEERDTTDSVSTAEASDEGQLAHLGEDSVSDGAVTNGEATGELVVQDKNTKPLPLIVKEYKFLFRLVAFPNPFGEGEQMQDKIEVWSSDEGYDIKNEDGISVPPEDNEIAILLIPYGFVNTTANITAEASIFDPVGNTIQATIPLTYNDKAIKQAWYGVWKAKNSVDRDVGPGTYICIAEVRESEGARPDTYKVMIGVKRREPQ